MKMSAIVPTFSKYKVMLSVDLVVIPVIDVSYDWV